MSHDQLGPLSADLLDRVVPLPDWQGAVAALDLVMKERIEANGRVKSGVVALVGPPGGPSDEIVTAWATAERWPVLRPPGSQSILNLEADWIDQAMAGADEGLAIASLDALYLRHHDGLRVLGRLLERLASSSDHPTLLGCGSFCWAYLNRVMNLEALIGPPLALAAFDEHRLGDWLLQLAELDGKRLAVHEAVSRKAVLPLTEEDISKERDAEPSDFIHRLAVHSRGLPNVAWAIWRQALRSTAAADAAAGGGPVRSLTLPSWSEMELPSVSSDISQDDLFVLHALLLHQALPSELLAAILPISAAEVSKSLKRLHVGGLISREGGHWLVSSAAYPAVRDALFESGHLVGKL